MQNFSTATTVSLHRSIQWNENPLISSPGYTESEVIVQVYCILIAAGGSHHNLGCRTLTFGAYGTLAEEDRPLFEGYIVKTCKTAFFNLLRGGGDLPYWAVPYRNGRVVVNAYATVSNSQNKSHVLANLRGKFPWICDSSQAKYVRAPASQSQSLDSPPSISSSQMSRAFTDSQGSYSTLDPRLYRDSQLSTSSSQPSRSFVDSQASTSSSQDPRRRPMGDPRVPPAQRNEAKPGRIIPPSQKSPCFQVSGVPVVRQPKRRLYRNRVPVITVRRERLEVNQEGTRPMVLHPDRRYFLPNMKFEPRVRPSRFN